MVLMNIYIFNGSSFGINTINPGSYAFNLSGDILQKQVHFTIGLECCTSAKAAGHRLDRLLRMPLRCSNQPRLASDRSQSVLHNTNTLDTGVEYYAIPNNDQKAAKHHINIS